MDKKGIIMLKFLTTVLLAIIIFAPACMFLSKFFRTSDQALGNFEDFAKEIVDLAENGKDQEKRNFLLILDENTAIVGFNQGKSLFQSCVKMDSGPESCWKWSPRNPKECQDGGCLCLFRDFIPLEDRVNLPSQQEVEYKSGFCEKTPVIFETPKFKELIEWSSEEKEYFNKDGFVLGREIGGILTGYQIIEEFNFKLRRNLIYLQKNDDKIFVCWEGHCEDTFKKVTTDEVSI